MGNLEKESHFEIPDETEKEAPEIVIKIDKPTNPEKYFGEKRWSPKSLLKTVQKEVLGAGKEESLPWVELPDGEIRIPIQGEFDKYVAATNTLNRMLDKSRIVIDQTLAAGIDYFRFETPESSYEVFLSPEKFTEKSKAVLRTMPYEDLKTGHVVVVETSKSTNTETRYLLSYVNFEDGGVALEIDELKWDEDEYERGIEAYAVKEDGHITDYKHENKKGGDNESYVRSRNGLKVQKTFALVLQATEQRLLREKRTR